MKVLSCFDGMSCGQIAFERAGIPIKKYYASEIDKYAIQITQKNYPDTVQLGSITEWQSWEIEKPDIIIGGSPCQGFSFAGKQLNFNDERSKLFFTFIEILKHYKPKYFLLENVIMKKEYNDVISGILGEIYPECVTQSELFRTGRLEPIEINSALVSAQNRRRLYWTNIQGIEQPEDKGILLKDIIENKPDTSAYFSEKAISGMINHKERHNNKGGNHGYNLISPEGKSNTILARCYKDGKENIITGGAFRGRNKENPSDRTQGIKTEQRLEMNTAGKQNTITSVSKDSIVCYGKNYVQYDENRTGNNSQEYRIFAKEGKSGTVIKSKCSIPKLKDCETATEIFWRKLTPVECERLQTVPDNYTSCVSNTRRYHALGNGWTVDVIAHIFRCIK